MNPFQAHGLFAPTRSLSKITTSLFSAISRFPQIQNGARYRPRLKKEECLNEKKVLCLTPWRYLTLSRSYCNTGYPEIPEKNRKEIGTKSER